MSDLNSNNKKRVDYFDLLARYIRYQKLSRSDNLEKQLNDLAPFGIDENEDLNNNLPDPNENLGDDDNLNKNNIEDKINEIENLSLNQLKKDKSFSSFISVNFFDSTIGKNLVAETFNKIVDIQLQFALMEYALKNGQNPMDLFNINLDWMIEKIGENQTVKLNGKEIKLQEKNEETRLYDPEFYLKCELVFNLFYLYSGDNLFDLFSVEEIGRHFGNCGYDFIWYCYKKNYNVTKENGESWVKKIDNNIESKFKAMDQINRRIGGLFGFVCSLIPIAMILIAIQANIVATLSPWILVIIPLGILAGWLIGKVQTFNKRDEIADLYEQQLPNAEHSLMQQTFDKFKSDYKQYKPKQPNEISSSLNQTDPNLIGYLSPKTENENDSIDRNSNNDK